MRPVSLHIEGFGVFRDAVDISFDGVDYFALVGPTGAGKSTVIDAICFALYGSIPRYDHERLVAPAVSSGKQEAKVSLTFDVGSERYIATRVVRVRDGKTSTPEALLEQLQGDQPTKLLAKRASEMSAAVEMLLGLPFAHFTKCVVLPQGDFARFLHDDPRHRQDLLSRLLDLQVYDQIGRRARERAAAARAAIDVHERDLAELAFATEAARTEIEARRDALRAFFKEVGAACSADEERAQAIAAADSTAARATAIITQLDTVAIPEDLAELAGAATSAQEQLRIAGDELAAAQLAWTALDAELEALPDRDALVKVRAAHVAIGELRTEGSALIGRIEGATNAKSDAERAAGDAAKAVAEAQHALVAVRDAHSAQTLAEHLVAGEPCPVCAQPVAKLPKRSRPATLASAEKAVTATERAAEKARKAAARAGEEYAALAGQSQQLTARLDALVHDIAEQPDLDAVDVALSNIETVAAAHTAARRREQAARAAEAAARDTQRAADARTANARQALQSTREALLHASLEPPDSADDPAAAWNALVAWSEATATEYRATAREAAATADAARAEREAALAMLVDRAAALGVPDGARDLTDLRDRVLEHGTNATNELDRVVDAIERAGKIHEQVTGARTDLDVADLLGTHMRADRFEKWVLAEALELLVASASETLVALSGGQYSLRYHDEEFMVVDHRNADATRSVRTLSGGETFQASLALALALSDQLAALSAGGGAKLDAIFLDEGFGTLDADTLETVATTIEALGSSGRMVGVVTHVPALAERVPVRYRVTRTDRTASVDREDA